ncbi:MAG TPA: hypothetical protein VM143_15505 [Acidimicrobiales bacterium]|nr:hypothetical protein [Acidimicrobiales bacterium]
MTLPAEAADLARLHWRRQLTLAIAGTAVGAFAFALIRISVARERAVAVATLLDGTQIRSASYLSTLWPAALGMLGLAILIVVLLVHAYRVAAFTFRRGDH